MQIIHNINSVYIGIIILTIIAFDSSETDFVKVDKLKTEYVNKPMGIDTEHPRLSWNLESKERNVQQKAYQVLVASDPELLTTQKVDMWNSGKTFSAKEVNVSYEGKSLKSDQSYYWKVRIWGQYDSTVWSDIGIFHTGLLKQSDWQGSWISAKDTSISAPLLRREFSLDKPIQEAIAFVTGVGYYEFYLNGHKVGNHVLDPGITNYTKRILYSTYDVTAQLKKGKNATGILLGNGPWRIKKKKNRFTPESFSHSFGVPIALLQLNIQFRDGTEKQIITDETWKYHNGPITYNNIYGGEDYDARQEREGWTSAEYDDSQWDRVSKVSGPGGRLQSQIMPSIKVTKTIQPIKKIHSKPGVYLFDLGQNIPGWWRVRIKGKRGTKVRIRGAETLNDSLFPMPLKLGDQLSTKQNYHEKVYTDYTLKGGETEVYEPRFFYSGFRYIEVTTDQPERLDSVYVEGRVVHTALERSGHFSTSDSLLNKIHSAAVWSQIGNTHSYPSDCPHREKGAYNGDGQVIAEAAMHDFNMASFYTKWVSDMRAAQQNNGRILNTSPTLLGGSGGGIAWGSAYILIPWWMHQYYGDSRILKKHYPTMKKYLGYLQDLASSDSKPEEKYIINDFGRYFDSLGEWCAPGERDGPNHPVVSTAYWYIDAVKLAKIASALGKSQDAKHYRAMADTIRQAFNRKFFNPKTNLYGTSEPYQTYLVLALAHNMAPTDHRKAVLQNLKDDIVNNQENHLNTGILGTKYLLPLLTEAGLGELAYTIVTQKTYPSWGYWIENGATTLWEYWSGRRSHNHQMFGSVDEFLYEYLAGIRAPTDNGTSAGYQKILIKPYVPDSLKQAGASLETIRGKVESKWIHQRNYLKLDVTLPANTTGKISVPMVGLHDVTITENGKQIWKNATYIKGDKGVLAGKRQGQYVTFNVVSGSYKFKLSGR